MPPFFMAIKLNLKGTSVTPSDSLTLTEWDPSTAIRDAKGSQPWASWPFDVPPLSTTDLVSAVIESPPAPDDTPGSEIKFSYKVKTIKVEQDGTSGATAKTNLATTTTNTGTGLTVNLAAAGGKVTGITVGNNAGIGYQVGDSVAITTAAAGTTATVIGTITEVAK
jgi:hypothetical protein